MRKFFFIICLLLSSAALLGVVFDYKLVEVIFKPLIVPSIFVYYLHRSNFALTGTFTSILILSFASDMASVFQFEKKQIFIIIFNLIINILFLKSFLKDYFALNFLDNKKLINGFLIMMALMFLVIVCLSMMPNLGVMEWGCYLFYGFVLSLMSTVAICNSILNDNLKIFYAMVLSISFICSDVFYVVYNFYMPMKIFLFLGQSIQFLSYFIIVNYFATNLTTE